MPGGMDAQKVRRWCWRSLQGPPPPRYQELHSPRRFRTLRTGFWARFGRCQQILRGLADRHMERVRVGRLPRSSTRSGYPEVPLAQTTVFELARRKEIERPLAAAIESLCGLPADPPRIRRRVADNSHHRDRLWRELVGRWLSRWWHRHHTPKHPRLEENESWDMAIGAWF